MGVTYNESMLTKARRCWFGTLWKPMKKNDESIDVFETRLHLYEKFHEIMCTYELSHAGCKWSYAYHEKGHEFPEFEHNECEHIHFVIVQDNPIVGTSLKKALQCDWVHLEIVKYSIEHCARYLLHLTVSAVGKEKIPFENLYCSGKGEHGSIWFPLISAHVYEPFIPNNCLHYVFNENMHTFLAFIARFGACVCHGAYSSAIKSALDEWGRNRIEPSFVEAVYETLDSDHRCRLCSDVKGFRASNIKETDFRFNFIQADGTPDWGKNSFWAESFQRLYIWWKCSDEIMNYDLHSEAERFGCFELLKQNMRRQDIKDVIERNSIFEDDLSSEIISQEASDIEVFV